MTDFRQASASSSEWIDVRKESGFSNFQFVDREFFSSPQLRRILSLARKQHYNSMVMEEIVESDCELLQQENESLARRCSDFQIARVRRLLFLSGKKDSEPEKLLGYAVFREDTHRNQSYPRTHVYESVVRPPRGRRANNFLHSSRDYTIETSLGPLHTHGVLYAQQNDRTYVCAHVALRTALSAVLPAGDITYPEINDLIGIDHQSRMIGDGHGLSPDDMEKVIEGCGLAFSKVVHEPRTYRLSSDLRGFTFTQFDNTPDDEKVELEGEFQRELYGILESGFPALLGFELSDQTRHIIPVFGHTFNDDTWVADSGRHYFVGEGLEYFPSENWLSAYTVHDDNFGPYLCIPRHYIARDSFRLILGLKPAKTAAEAPEIEALGLSYANALVDPLVGGTPWQRRFALFAKEGLLVLRTLLVVKKDYLAHLTKGVSWQGNAIGPAVLAHFEATLPNRFWMVEMSAPELFPASRHKFGEVLISTDAVDDASKPTDFSHFLACRMPGLVFHAGDDPSGLGVVESGVQSHLPLFELEAVFDGAS